MKISGVYIIRCKANQNIYIGSSVDIQKRFVQHKGQLEKNKHCNPRIQRAWNKYGEKSFEFREIIRCQREDTRKIEQVFLDAFKAICGSNVMNISLSTTHNCVFGRKLSKETKRKISIARTGFKWGIEQRLNMSESRKGNAYRLGKPHTEEAKKKISAGGKGRVVSEETRAKMGVWQKGRPKSEEAKEKMRLAWKNRKPASEETRRKMSEAHKKRWAQK